MSFYYIPKTVTLSLRKDLEGVEMFSATGGQLLHSFMDQNQYIEFQK